MFFTTWLKRTPKVQGTDEFVARVNDTLAYIKGSQVGASLVRIFEGSRSRIVQDDGRKPGLYPDDTISLSSDIVEARSFRAVLVEELAHLAYRMAGEVMEEPWIHADAGTTLMYVGDELNDRSMMRRGCWFIQRAKRDYPGEYSSIRPDPYVLWGCANVMRWRKWW